MFLAHGPISYILNESIQKKSISKLSKKENLLVMILSILFGILPDIDLAILSMTNIPSFQHHTVFTHSALFYIAIWILLNIFLRVLKTFLNKDSQKVLRDEFLNVIQWAFLIGTLSHFLADILFSYSKTLFPIDMHITILGDIFGTNYFSSYIFSPNFATEILFISIFIIMVYRRYLKRKLILDILTYSLIPLSTIFLLFSLYMNLNTYNKAYMIVDGQRVLDMDYDGILDRYDSDTNNDGIKNIHQLNTEEATHFVKKISNNRYMVTNSDDTWGNIKYLYGAFGSYRLISQTYYEQNLPIEPVLREYYISKNTLNGYNLQIHYPNLFYEYLTRYGDIKMFEEKDKGDIFFVLQDNAVVNMGIVLDQDTLGIVLLKDTRLVTHTTNEILDEYPNAQLKAVGISQLK